MIEMIDYPFRTPDPRTVDWDMVGVKARNEPWHALRSRPGWGSPYRPVGYYLCYFESLPVMRPFDTALAALVHLERWQTWQRNMGHLQALRQLRTNHAV
jgi:hypothetical protein